MLNNNLIALALTILIAVVWLRLNVFLAHRDWISSTLSRKIIHIGTGPFFVLCWLLFKETSSAPFIAAVVPLAITDQFALVGTGVIKDPSAVAALSRTGDRREILRGPLYYGIVFVLLTIAFWRRSPTGIVALMILCGGDGLADIVGKKSGRNQGALVNEKVPCRFADHAFGRLCVFSIGVVGFHLGRVFHPTTHKLPAFGRYYCGGNDNRRIFAL